jgi:hypothetical protein
MTRSTLGPRLCRSRWLRDELCRSRCLRDEPRRPTQPHRRPRTVHHPIPQTRRSRCGQTAQRSGPSDHGRGAWHHRHGSFTRRSARTTSPSGSSRLDGNLPRAGETPTHQKGGETNQKSAPTSRRLPHPARMTPTTTSNLVSMSASPWNRHGRRRIGSKRHHHCRRRLPRPVGSKRHHCRRLRRPVGSKRHHCRRLRRPAGSKRRLRRPVGHRRHPGGSRHRLPVGCRHRRSNTLRRHHLLSNRHGASVCRPPSTMPRP